MMEEEERWAMCEEIAKLAGINRRKPGWVTVAEYASSQGLSDSGARKQLGLLAAAGRVAVEDVLLNSRRCKVYKKI